MKQKFDPELFELLCKKYKSTLEARKKHDQIKNSIMNKQIKLRGVLLCIGVTVILTLLFTISLIKKDQPKVKKNTISLKEYKLLEEEIEIIRKDAGDIQYELYLATKENRRLLKENKIFGSLLGEIENTECGSKLLKKFWDQQGYE
jgi:hypothetical protein